MAKNKKFKKQYIINVEGITTNDFASELIDKFINNIAIALDVWFKQVDVTIEPVEKVEK